MDPLSSLLPRRAAFVREYLKDLNASRAARAAGYSAAHSHTTGFTLLKTPEVAAAIAAAQAERNKRLGVEADDVLRLLLDAATADPNDLMQVRRVNCRYCHGTDFRYQRTARELARDRAQHAADIERKQKDADMLGDTEVAITAFDEQGGDGFERAREPNDECPECSGDGEVDVYVADSRLLTGSARRLFAGVKVTKDGIEIKMRDQDKAVELLGRHLGLFNDKLELSGQVDLANAVLAGRKRKAPPEPGSDLC